MTFPFRSPELLETYKEAAYVQAQQQVDALYIIEIKKVLAWFRDKFPNHELRWMDGMGTHFWVLDDEIWDCSTLHHAPIYRDGGYWGDSQYLSERPWTRKEILLKPLVDFFASITDDTWSPECGVQIGCWEIDRVSREVIQNER